MMISAGLAKAYLPFILSSLILKSDAIWKGITMSKICLFCLAAKKICFCNLLHCLTKKIPIFEIVMQNYFEKALFGATTLSITTLSAMTFSIVLNKARKILMLSFT